MNKYYYKEATLETAVCVHPQERKYTPSSPDSSWLYLCLIIDVFLTAIENSRGRSPAVLESLLAIGRVKFQ